MYFYIVYVEWCVIVDMSVLVCSLWNKTDSHSSSTVCLEKLPAETGGITQRSGNIRLLQDAWGEELFLCVPALKHLWNSFLVSSNNVSHSFEEILLFISRWLGVLCSLCMMPPAWPESGWSTSVKQSNCHHLKPWTTAHPGQRETERTGTCGVLIIWLRYLVKCCRTLHPCLDGYAVSALNLKDGTRWSMNLFFKLEVHDGC